DTTQRNGRRRAPDELDESRAGLLRVRRHAPQREQEGSEQCRARSSRRRHQESVTVKTTSSVQSRSCPYEMLTIAVYVPAGKTPAHPTVRRLRSPGRNRRISPSAFAAIP